MLHKREMLLTPDEPPGVHSLGSLESAVCSAINHYLYMTEADISVLAAVYVLHIAQNHAFLSGNKRTAQAACVTFLEGNGYTFLRSDDAFGKLIERVVE